MSRNSIESLLARYQKGQTSSEENILVENWLEQNGNSNSEWLHLDQNSKDKWLGDVFGKIQDTIAADEPKIVQLHQRNRLWKRIVAVAAVLTLFLTVYYQAPSLFSRYELATLSVPANQKKQLTLPDGSIVWINAGSELKYPEQFDGKTREVYLKGEAYFDIKHNASKAFIIHTGKVVTTVLGTAFNIKEDESKQTIVVTVTRGKVKVANGSKELGIITPNQQISVDLINSKAIQTQVDASDAIAWQESELHFEDITFAEAATKLEQRFNVKINFSNEKTKECRFTGTALTGKTLESILNVLCAFNNATYQTKDDGSILINGNGCD